MSQGANGPLPEGCRVVDHNDDSNGRYNTSTSDRGTGPRNWKSQLLVRGPSGSDHVPSSPSKDRHLHDRNFRGPGGKVSPEGEATSTGSYTLRVSPLAPRDYSPYFQTVMEVLYFPISLNLRFEEVTDVFR